MWELWVDEEIESPYFELMEYSSGVNNGGHHCHFDNIAENKDLKTYVDALTKILPEPLKSNVERAYKTYIKNPDDISDEDVAVFDSCDDVYYKNEDLVNGLLKERADKIEL